MWSTVHTRFSCAFHSIWLSFTRPQQLPPPNSEHRAPDRSTRNSPDNTGRIDHRRAGKSAQSSRRGTPLTRLTTRTLDDLATAFDSLRLGSPQVCHPGHRHPRTHSDTNPNTNATFLPSPTFALLGTACRHVGRIRTLGRRTHDGHAPVHRRRRGQGGHVGRSRTRRRVCRARKERRKRAGVSFRGAPRL